MAFLMPLAAVPAYAQEAEEELVLQEAPSSETQFPIAPADGLGAGSSGGGLGIGVYVRMVVVLAVIVLAIWLFARFFKKNVNGGVDENPFVLRKVASISLGAGKSVQIVSLLDDRAYLLGVTDDSVTLLGTIEDTPLIQALNINADDAENTPRPKNFAEVLDLFTRKKGSGQEKAAPEAPLSATLSQLRARLNGDGK